MWGTAQSLPYSYGFETDLLVLEDGWTKYFGTSLTSNNNECGIVGVAKKTGSYGFRFSSYNAQGANAQYLISPEFNAPTGIDLTFYYATSANSSETFAVGYSTTDADVSSFTWGSTITNASTSWSKYENSFPSGTKYIAIYYFSDYKWRLYVDDFTFAVGSSAPITCPTPTALTKGAVTTTSATFTWTAGGGTNETDWQYVCLPAADALDWTGAATATSETATVTGLTENTNYKFYVRSNCGSTDGYSAEVIKEFHTPCAGYATASLPYSETFEGVATGTGVYNIPSCWNRSAYVSATYGTLPYVSATEGHDAAKCLYFRKDATSTTTATIVLPPFEAATNTLTLSFWYKHNMVSSSYGKFTIGYMTDPEDVSTFMGLSGALDQVTTYTKVDEFALTGAPASSYIAIQYTGGNSSYGTGYIDDIVVTQASSCAKPTDLTASAADATSINLSWKKGGDESKWNAQYRIGSGDWTAVNDIETTVDGTNCTATLTVPSANKTYEIQVQADCSGSTSSWSNSATEKTPCLAQTVISFGEDFESTQAGYTPSYDLYKNMPDCWDAISDDEYVYVRSSGGKTGQCLYMYGSSSAHETALLPVFTEDLNTQTISFYYKNYTTNASYGQLKVGYYNGGEFTSLAALDRRDSYDSKPYSLVLSTIPSGARIAFKIDNGTYKNEAYIDDVTLAPTPSCYAPKNLVRTALTNNSASFSWDASGKGEDTYQWAVAVGAAAPAWEDNAAHKVTTTSVTVNGLTAGTAYKFYVRSYCGAADQSDSIISESFTPICPIPTNVQFTNKTYNGATITWEAGSGETEWNLNYQENELGWVEVNGLTSTSYDMPTLVTGHTYTVQIEAACHGGWTSEVTYTPGYTAPETASVTGATDATATASWSAVADADGEKKYEYLVKEGTAAPTTSEWAAATKTNEISATLSGLMGGTSYTFYVRAIYQTGVSDSTLASFSTSTIKPKNLTNTAVTKTTATFTWENDGAATQYQWACKASGSPEESDWNGPIDEANYTVTSGLVAASTYTFYVRSYYDAGKVSANASKTFTTACDVIQTADLPWTSDLSSLTCYPHASTSDGAYSVDIYNSSEFRFAGGSTNSSRKVVVALPEFEEDIQNLKIQITYMTKGATASYPGFYIGYITDVDNVVTSYSDISGATKYQSTTSTTTSFVSLSAVPDNAKRIAICYRTNGASSSPSYGYSYISSIHVESATCPAPASIETTEILPDGATIDWTGTATRYQYSVVDQNVEPTSWTLLDENVYTLTLHEYAPGATHDVWVRSYCDADLQSDSVKTSFAAVCPAPTSPEVSTITEASATLSWTAASGITDYQYVVLAKDAAEDWTGAVKVEGATTANLSGLAANTAYDVYVRSFYSNISQSASVKVSFRTACAAISSLPYTETFESQNVNEVPSCWDVIVVDGSDYPVIKTSNSSSHRHNGSKGLLINNKHLKYGFAILPEFEAALNTLQISFWHKEESASASNCGNLELGYLTNIADSTTFHLIKKCDLSSSWVAENEVSLADVPAGTRVAFRYIGKNTSWEYYTAIDDITIEVRPSCPKPKNVTVSAITAHTASVAWTNGSSETAWALQTSTNGSDWSTEIPADENPFTLTGLEAQTSYYVRVKAVCGVGDESEWSEASAVFTTKCESTALPFEENFDSGTSLPACWSASGWGSSANQWTIYTYQGHSGSNSARYNARISTSNYADLITAPIAIETNTKLTFYHTNSSCTGEVYVDNGSAQTKLMDITSAADWMQETIDLSAYAGSSINIIFRAKGAGTSSTRYFYIDDVRVFRGVTLVDNVNNTATLAGLVGQTLEVTLGRTIYCDGDFNTLCLPFSLPTLAGTPLAGGELWSFRYGEVVGGELQIRIAPATSIEAGVPYLITFANGADIVNPTFTDVTITKSVGVSVGQTDDVQFIGILKPQAFVEEDKNNLFVASNGMLAWSNVGTGTALSNLRSFRGYFHTETAVSGTPVANNMPARIVKEEQTATGCENIQDNTVTIKIIENNQVVIIRNGVKYTVQGQVISK